DYVTHFGRHYAMSNRHIMRTWVRGAVQTLHEVWRERVGEVDLDDDALARVVAETGCTPEAARATHALRVPSGEIAMLPIARELWLDRLVLLSATLTASAASTLFVGKRAGMTALGGAAALFAVYERLTPKPDLRTYDAAPPEVRQVLDIH